MSYTMSLVVFMAVSGPAGSSPAAVAAKQIAIRFMGNPSVYLIHTFWNA